MLFSEVTAYYVQVYTTNLPLRASPLTYQLCAPHQHNRQKQIAATAVE